MKLLEQAVTERVKQLQRQANTAMNPLIRQILQDEIKALQIEWANLPTKK